jgi:hypothetical protein
MIMDKSRKSVGGPTQVDATQRLQIIALRYEEHAENDQIAGYLPSCGHDLIVLCKMCQIVTHE